MNIDVSLSHFLSKSFIFRSVVKKCGEVLVCHRTYASDGLMSYKEIDDEKAADRNTDVQNNN